MSINSEPIDMDLAAQPDDPAIDEVESAGNDDAENITRLTHREYDALEEAVMQTPRGRTFLREHARRNRAVASDLVVRALDDYSIQIQRQELKKPAEILSAELQNMSDAIAHTRRDIAAIKPKEGANNRIMAATEDLDAIVTATERATNDILAAAEHIQETCEAIREKGGSSEQFDALDESITNIFLACSFQDITGQRTTKVVNALRYLEQRVGAMVEIWGSEALRNGMKSEFDFDTDDDHPEAGLLNGPAREGQGVAQDDIDALMNTAPAITDENASDVAADNDKADPTAGIDFDEAADPTAGIDFDAAGTLPAETDPVIDDATAAIMDVEAAAAEFEAAADVPVDDADYSGLSEEADADTIDAIFNS